MVETITPVVHGGRTRRWAIALSLHVVGAAVSAAAFGAVLGGLGMALGAPWGSPGIAAVAALAMAYLVRDAFGVRVPVPQLRRQVPEWWRTFFGYGPAALLYGMGLGIGFLTFLRHGTLVVVSAAAAASGRPALGALLVAPFGVARGLSATIAAGARTPDDGTALVGRLSASASWIGWRIAHVTALVAVIVGAAFAIDPSRGSADVGGVAAAALSVAFGWAAASKLAHARRWARSLESYGLRASLRRPVAVGVPMIELGVAALPFVGLPSSAGAASIVVLATFSVAIVAARVRNGPRLVCGCFGGTRARDYRLLLARNAGLALVAFIALRWGTDAWIGEGALAPTGADVVPAALVAAGLVLAVWAVAVTVRTVRRGAA